MRLNEIIWFEKAGVSKIDLINRSDLKLKHSY